MIPIPLCLSLAVIVSSVVVKALDSKNDRPLDTDF